MHKTIMAQGIEDQFLASLKMLKDCIERCPADEWNESHNDYPFCQVVFHTLFDCDYNLSNNVAQFKDQKFHKMNGANFSDYAELEVSWPTKLYERQFLISYFEHCVEKVIATLRSITVDDFLTPDSDIYKNMMRFERFTNAIRHIQHHAAQLGLRLQFSTGKEMDWISRG